MIRVVVVDDHPVVCAGMARLISNENDIEVVATALDGEKAIELDAELRPDVVLMDVRMPHVDGIEATARIVADDQSARVLMLTTFDLDDYVYAALRAGASGFLLKDAPAEQLVQAVRVIAAVDEADIGEVKTGQTASFTVDAYPNRKFAGVISGTGSVIKQGAGSETF